ncbi:phage regulatory protein/antirepressor Ant [Bacteroides fragilis]|nr:phage regulatory protein/antirepressor Ant [Bacteroides fragilis]
MKDLVFKGESNQVLTSSLLVADKFGKNHKHVLDAIRELINSAEKSAVLKMFVPSTYIASNNKENPMFIMNRDGFTLLAMGFTGEKALQFKLEYINAFNKMEEAIKNGGFNVPKSFREALLLAAEQQEVIENQQKQIEEKNAKIEADKPKVLFSEAVSASNKSILVRELAKLITQNGYQIGEKQLYERLRKAGYLCNSGESYNQPTQTYMNMGLFHLKKTSVICDGESKVYTVTKVTPKGQIYFINKFLGKGMK